MPTALSIVIPFALAGVLAAGGVAKLRSPDELDGWRELGVPALLRQRWLLKLHPWGELALAAALIALGGWLGIAAAAVALLLMLAYLALVVRTWRSGVDTECACFGERKPVTAVTVLRNVWYVALAAGAIVVIGANPLWGGALAALPGAEWAWIVAAVIVAVTVALTLWPTDSPVAPAPVAPVDASVGELLDYVPVRTPSVPVTLADGTEVSLRTLSMQQPMLVIAVTPGCSPCEQVRASLPDWRALLPELKVRLLVTAPPESAKLKELDEPQSLHDPYNFVRDSIGEWSTPSAVLLGGDGFIAGGPVSGYSQIAEFVDDIYESLHGEKPAR